MPPTELKALATEAVEAYAISVCKASFRYLDKTGETPSPLAVGTFYQQYDKLILERLAKTSVWILTPASDVIEAVLRTMDVMRAQPLDPG